MPSKIGRKSLAGILVFLCIAGYAYYFYFVETLTLSQIVGKTNAPIVDFVVNVLDFDTGLTRNDIHRLLQNSASWHTRITRVESIQDPTLRLAEREKLITELMQDPALKKIIKKLLGFGAESAFGILRAVLQE